MFEGFSPETIDFLWGLRLNNNREWFQAHKSDYQKTLYEPMKALASHLFQVFSQVPNMEHKVSRIYKDARLHPAVPYKESLWISMRPSMRHWSEQPTLYFEITPDGYSYGTILWHPKMEAMERYPALIAARPDEFLAMIAEVERQSGLRFGGQEYARKKACPVEEVKAYYNLKNIMMDVERGPDELLFSPDLAEEVAERLKALYPLYEYCLKFTI